MRLPYSNNVAMSDTIDGSSVVSLFNGIVAIWDLVGWTHTAITDGREYLIVSPQLYRAKVQIVRNGTSYVSIQFLQDGTFGTTVGYFHRLYPVATATYQCWANVCSTFINRMSYSRITPGAAPDTPGDLAGGTSMCGGIPAVPRVNLADTQELWFSSGDGPFGGDFSNCFRNANVSRPASSSCFNNLVLVSSSNGSPRMLTPIPSTDVYSAFVNAARAKWADDEPFYMPAYVGWGKAAEVPRIGGAMYDVLFSSRPRGLDEDITLIHDDEGVTRNWRNYTYDPFPPAWTAPITVVEDGRYNFFGSWLLLKSTAASVIGNVAY